MDIKKFLREAQQKMQHRKTKSSHFRESLLWDYVAGQLSGRNEWRLGAHLASCIGCADKVGAIQAQMEYIDTSISFHLSSQIELESSSNVSSWVIRMQAMLHELILPRRLIAHALAFGVASVVLWGANVALNQMLASPANPLSSPISQPAPWAWYPIGTWGGLLFVHLVFALWHHFRD